jgi:hypothetical protein
MKLLRIAPEQIAQRWDEIEPYLTSGLDWSNGDFNVEHAKVYVSMNQWLLIGVFDGNVIKGAMTVSFSNLPNDRVAFITAIGGKNITNRDTFDQFKAILKAYGATKIQGSVRQSVARLWRRLGFQERSIIVEQKL